MSIEEIYEEACTVIQEWAGKKKHGLCWYCIGHFRMLAKIFDIKPSKEPFSHSLEEFKQG